MRRQYTYAFPRPSVTATVVLLVQASWNTHPDSVILGKRGRKDGTYAGYWCLPGGFLDAKVDTADVEIEFDRHAYMSIAGYEDEIGSPLTELLDDYEIDHDPAKPEEAFNKPGETIEETAVREIFEETGLKITMDRLELAHVHSDPNTDPRAHVVNICYFVMLDHKEAVSAVAGDDLEELKIASIYEVEKMDLAFNHKDLFVKILPVAESKYQETYEEE